MTYQWVVYLIEAFIVINILLLSFAYTTLLERNTVPDSAAISQQRVAPRAAASTRVTSCQPRPSSPAA